MLRNTQDCEDVMQEGLLLAFKNLRQFEGRSSFATWLHSIIRNSARTHVRRMKCRPKCSSQEELSDENRSTFDQHFVDRGLSPEEECVRRERSRVLREVVQKLPSGYGFAMQLCDVEGLEPKDASQILGISSCALKTSLFRARRLAARQIRRRCCPTKESLQNNEGSNPDRNCHSGFSRKENPVCGSERAERKRKSLHAGAPHNRGFVGCNDEPHRKSSEFWKRSLPALGAVHGALRNTRRPAC